MGEVKLFRLSGSAAVIDLRTGNNATLRPGLVVLSEDAHTHAIATLEAENAKLRAELERRAVPGGWKLVPVEPTEEMLESDFISCHCGHDFSPALFDHVWHKMLAAAPSAPKADDPVKQMLMEALEALSKSAPSACCVDFHHRPCDYHGADETCPALDRYEGACLAARAAIAAARKGGKV